MFNVVLFEPEIPPNTGNIIRLCANAGCALHLVEPLGFELDERRLRRAGLDYREWARVAVHPNFDACLRALRPVRILGFSTLGTRTYSDVAYRRDDVLLFGPESRGLPAAILARVPEPLRIRIPLVPGNRSLNLSNAVAIAVYEAWRQHEFAGAATEIRCGRAPSNGEPATNSPTGDGEDAP